jgi:lipoprotein-anchoring transpeptidase ErfK/SrfK
MITKMRFTLAVLLLVSLFLGIYFTDTIYKFSNQASIDTNNLSDEYDNSEQFAIFDNKQIPVTSEGPSESTIAQSVLGEDDSSDEKRIEVDLTNQKVYAYEGDERVMEFLVSTGKWGKTPTGEFRIWTKLRYTKMSGGSKALHTYYYLPNVPFVMYFSNSEVAASRGFSLHGTYWHSNFGHPMSHGCVNMKTEEVEQLYYWAHPELGDKQSIRASKDNPGTKIIIYGEAPNE